MKKHLDGARDGLSDAVHSCVVEALSLPQDTRFHRFIGLEPSEFRFPPGRSEKDTIVEVSVFEGRSAGNVAVVWNAWADQG